MAAILTWPVDGTCGRIDNVGMARGKKKSAGDGGGKRLEVVCPCCATELLVDAATGVVLREDRKKGPRQSFDDALAAERKRKKDSDALFGKALKSQRDSEKLLDAKFDEAMKKAAEEMSAGTSMTIPLRVPPPSTQIRFPTRLIG